MAQDTLPMQRTCAVHHVCMPCMHKEKELAMLWAPFLSPPLLLPLPLSCLDTGNRNTESQLALR